MRTTARVLHCGAWWRSRWLLAALAVVVVVAAVMVVAPDEDPPIASPNTPVHPGDASRLVADVTIPDKTVVKPDTQFVKVWEIQNSGSVHWRDRYLQRTELPIGPDDCRTPERIPINDTAPQQHVQIAVTVRTPPTAPVDCKVLWKMVDESGRKLLPSQRPVYFEVWVRS
jgi:Ig-like domain from next to BRCA1 gene